MNTFGRLFRVHIYGESHGTGTGILIDGCPAGIPLEIEDFEPDMARRRSGRKGTTPRTEPDLPKITNGVYDGHTTGAPINIFIENTNTRSSDYEKFRTVPRPGHADFTANIKYNNFDDRCGSGHFSGRVSAGLVAAGVIAKKILGNTKVSSSLISAGGKSDIEGVLAAVDGTGDSIGGIVETVVTGVPAGLGEPYFDSAEACIAHIVFAIGATKGIEFGSGFAAAAMRGSEHNDPIISVDGRTSSNNAGGINGGITNGNDIVFRVAVKPTSSISLPQRTIDLATGEMTELLAEGRHDQCIALRIPVVIEAAAAIALADLALIARGISARA